MISSLRGAGLALLLFSLARLLPAQSDYEPAQPPDSSLTLRSSAVFGEAVPATPQKITKTLQGVTFDSDYDNGSLLDVRETGPNRFECDLYTELGELGSRRYWFRFRIIGAAGRTLHLALEHRQNARPAVRFGDGPWRRMTPEEALDARSIVLAFDTSTNTAEVAFFYPLGYAEMYEEVESLVRTSNGATTHLLGMTTQGRELWMVQVTDPLTPDEFKHRVWVHARAHPGESTAAFTFLGLLDQVTENSAVAYRLRRNCIFNLVPMINPDGIFLGHTRWDSRGIDPEREWDTPGRTPEVASLYATVNRFMASDNPIEVALNLHSTVGRFKDSFFFKHTNPSVTSEFEEIQRRYIEAFRNATPLFDNLEDMSSELHPNQFVESYYWNHWGDSVMAMTHEGHFGHRITDNDWITDEDYRELGRGLAAALIEYFELPPLPASQKWGWYLY